MLIPDDPPSKSANPEPLVGILVLVGVLVLDSWGEGPPRSLKKSKPENCTGQSHWFH